VYRRKRSPAAGGNNSGDYEVSKQFDVESGDGSSKAEVQQQPQPPHHQQLENGSGRGAVRQVGRDASQETSPRDQTSSTSAG